MGPSYSNEIMLSRSPAVPTHWIAPLATLQINTVAGLLELGKHTDGFVKLAKLLPGDDGTFIDNTLFNIRQAHPHITVSK